MISLIIFYIKTISFIGRKTCQVKVLSIVVLLHQPHFKPCANLVNHLKKIILSQGFRERHRRTVKDFGRSRKLPFHLVVIFFLNFIKGSYQDELDNFFKTLLGFDVAKRMVSKAALCKARLKLKFEAFIELNNHLAEFYYKNFSTKTWLGHRLVRAALNNGEAEILLTSLTDKQRYNA